MKKVLLAMSCFVSINANAVEKTALMSAAEYNDLYSVEKLIQAGYNVNDTDSNGNTAYCYAYGKKNLNIAKSLEKFGADTSRNCNIKGIRFSTKSLSAPYFNNKETSTISRKRTSKLKSSFLGNNKRYIYAGLGVAGIAAAAGGGGGGGGGSAASGGGSGSAPFVKPPTSTDVSAAQLAVYETSEFYANAASKALPEPLDSEFLDIINAQFAYARLRNGAGQKIAVLDSGLDTDHPEFIGQVAAGDLTGSDLQSGDNDPSHVAIPGDDNDHGSMVASIAAGRKDNNGMHGVAYGSTIVPFRVGNGSGGIDSDLIDNAVNDGITKGARTFNFSFGVATKDKFGNHVIDATEATQDILETLFTGNQVVGSGVSADMTTMISNVTTSESIIVESAGNKGTAQPSVGTALPIHFTDMQGHFVNVVALNAAGNSIASYSNRCGITKNYCLAAPGSSMMLAGDGGTYKLADGTSFAAPTVSGAVAIVKGAFGLSADKTLNILFKTASDMGAAGVDDIYGHGLLNLDKATAPGAELITSSNSNNSFAYSTTSLTTSNAFANLQVPNFIVEDELYRTFKVNGSDLTSKLDEKVDLQDREKSFAKEKKIVTKKLENGLRTSFVMSNEKTSKAIETFDYLSIAGKVNGFDLSFGFTNAPGQELDNMVRSVNLIKDDSLANPYIGLAEKGFVASSDYELGENLTFQTNVFFGEIENDDNKNMGKSTSALAKLIYKLDEDSQVSLESGFLNEKNTVLGSKFEGAFGLSDNTYTYFTGLKAKTNLTNKVDIFANAYIGVTKASSGSNSLVTDVSDIVSHAASIGAQYNFTNKKAAGLVISQPLKVSNGQLNYSYLSGGNVDKGYQHTSKSKNLSPSATQLDIQAFYKQELAKDKKLNLGLMHSFNAENNSEKDNTSVLVKYRSKF